jgi:cytoskeletal protein CcmA (bactofilin family)
MKERKREFEEDNITGFFDKETEIKGELSFKGSFRIDGRFKGKVDSDSMLVIGESGTVDADIKIGYMVIDGEVKGTIQATDRVEVHSNGRVIGTITTPKLIVEEGAYLEATCQTTDKMPASAPPIPPQKEDKAKDTIATGPEL